tara:strand:- start:70 stop:624 length:555 start_codon:yes stop_codon:yes gene_type:complete
MDVRKKHREFCDLLGNNLRSKIVVKLLDGAEFTSDELLVYVNKFNLEDDYKKSIINKNLTGLKDLGFAHKRKDGHKTFWTINQKNKFISNLIKLMKAPKNDNTNFDGIKEKKKNKTTDEWSEIVMEKINSIVTSRDLSFTPKNILETGIDISNQRLYQILIRLMSEDKITKRKDTEGEYILILE